MPIFTVTLEVRSVYYVDIEAADRTAAEKAAANLPVPPGAPDHSFEEAIAVSQQPTPSPRRNRRKIE